MDLSLITAIVDTREQTPWPLEGMNKIRRGLSVGDYSIESLEHLVALERKSLPDLLGCIGKERERFERCIEKLLTFESKAIIVESSWEYFLSGNWSEFGPREPGGPRLAHRSRIYPKAAIGSVLGWLERGIPIIFAGDPQHSSLCASRFLYLAAKRRRELLQPLRLGA